MKDTLAEQLLKNELKWDTRTATQEIKALRYLALFKYDGYRNFEPGMRFLESLVLWLRQFKRTKEKLNALEFVKTKLLYISEVQTDHLVNIFFPQRILPILYNQVHQETGFPSHQIKKIRSSEIFAIIKRKSLFLGMSDGARMDTFRRRHNLDNEQVSVYYELSPEKWEGMQKSLKRWLKEKKIISDADFINIFLIDDFSGSGNTILRLSKNGYRGKLWKFITTYLGSKDNQGELGKVCKKDGPNLFIATYLSTEQSYNRLKKEIKNYCSKEADAYFSYCKILRPLQLFENKIKLSKAHHKIDKDFNKILKTYYDKSLEDEHTKTGGKDVIHGYAGCSLPIVLSHNCPNNSVYLLWAKTEDQNGKPKLRALFPRIARHLQKK